MREPDKMPRPVAIFVNEIAAFGGVERLILALSRYLHDAGVDHEVVCFHDTLGLGSLATWPVRIAPLSPARNILSEAKAFRRYFEARGVGAPAPLIFDQKGAFYVGLSGYRGAHIHFTDQPSLLGRDVSKWAWSAPAALRPVATPGFPARARGEIVHRLNRRGVRSALSLIAMTHRAARELEALYGRQGVIIRPGVTSPSEMAAHDRTTGRRDLLSVCRLEPGKRVEWIIEAFEHMAAARPDWRLTIVGDGEHRAELELFARQQISASRISFRGRVSDDELEDAYADAGAFAMPAVQGYGLPALEALARGAPVVLHRESGVSEILEGNPWAEIVAGDRAAFASGLERLIARIEDGALACAAPPRVPRDSEWARSIAAHCGWL